MCGTAGQNPPEQGVQPGPVGRMQLRVAVSAAQHKIVNLLKT